MCEKTSDSALKVIALGGLGEIGLNMMVFEYEDTIVLVDCGLMFPEEEMLGVDIVIPDFSYLLARKEKVAALVVTHGHEDHIGAIPFLVREFSIPIYGTALTLALIREKLREHNLLDRVELIQIVPRQVADIGPFAFEFIRVCHSIPDGVGLAIRTPVGVLIHSGDFKIDNTPVDGQRLDIPRLGSYGEEGVLALFSDSTNVERAGYTVSEKEVGVTLRNVIREKRGRVIVAVFASNLHRIQQLIEIAREFGRKVLLSGKSMVTNVRLARELGCLDFTKEDEISIQDLPCMPDSQVLMITTGTQGEPMSALSRMAFNDHKKLKVGEGDTIILSSRFIPGNERTIQNIINHLYRNGAEVIHEQVKDIHVSGHACQEELKILINVVKPRFFIPIHGEFRHLVKHRKLAMSLGIAPANCLLMENGRVMRFSSEEVCTKDRVETGRVFVDGKGVGDIGGLVLRDRRHLSEDGLVIVSLVVDKESHEILSGPDIFSRGFIHEETKPEILYEGQCIIFENIDRQMAEAHELDCALLQEQIRRDLKRFFIRMLDRRPVIYPIVVEI
jgi:ribonuclease J